MIQECFKLLTGIMENEDARSFINERQMKCLLDFIEQFIFGSEKNIEALACFKVLILIYFIIFKLK